MALALALPQASRTSCRFANPLAGGSTSAGQSPFHGAPGHDTEQEQ